MLSAKDQKTALEKELGQNLESVRARINQALDRCGEPQRNVTIVTVTKKQPLDRILALTRLGHLDFGENYVQEGLEKMRAVGESGIKWHFIGGLQSNKAKYIPGMFQLVHSLDSLKAAKALHKKAGSLGLVQEVLIQVNLARETQKSGVVEEDLPGLCREISRLENLRLSGLMLMPPLARDPEESRPYFTRLRLMRQRLEEDLGLFLPHLSMGMSQDFVQAVEEGATLIRIGTLILGPRPGCAYVPGS